LNKNYVEAGGKGIRKRSRVITKSAFSCNRIF